MSGWVAGGTVVAGIGSALIGGNASSKASKGQLNVQKDQLAHQKQLDAPVIDARNLALAKAKQIDSKGYAPYTGQRIANLSANETQAGNLAGTTPGQADFDKARGLLDEVSGSQFTDADGNLTKAGGYYDSVAGSQFDPDTISGYMNPYVENVVNRNINNVNSASAKNLNALRGQAASRGAFGGARQSLLETGAERERLKAVGDVSDQGYKDAYDRGQTLAVDAWKTGNQNKLQAAQGNQQLFSSKLAEWQSNTELKTNAAAAYQAAGNDVTRMNSEQIQNLMATGGAQRVLEQMNLDFDYDQFLRTTGADQASFENLMMIANQGGSGGPGYVEDDSSSTTGQVLGSIAAMAGFFGKNSGTPSTTSTTKTGATTQLIKTNPTNTGINQNLSLTGY